MPLSGLNQQLFVSPEKKDKRYEIFAAGDMEVVMVSVFSCFFDVIITMMRSGERYLVAH